MRPVSRGLSFSRPVAILSDNSVDHALLAYACRYVGMPVAPISQAYSLMSKDHAKFKATFALLPPGLVYGGDEAPAQVLAHANVRAAIAHGMRALRAGGGGSSTFAPRALLLLEPPNIDAGEITDKGYINQRAVLVRRQALVRALHADPPSEDVICI